MPRRHVLDIVTRADASPGATPIFLPQAAALVDNRGFITRPWWPWFQQIVEVLQALVANGGGSGGGGGDVYTDRANVFTVTPQTIRAAGPSLLLTDTAQAPNAQRVAVRNAGGLLRLEAQNDAGTPIAAVTIDRAGVLTATGLDGTPLDATQLSGLVPLASVPAHAPRHTAAGSDPIKLDALATPDDVPTLNATTARHGLLPKLSGASTQFLTGVGTWAPASAGGGGDVVGPAGAVADRIATFNGTTGKLIQDGGYTITGVMNITAAHHTTHEPGGSDALVNAAWTNLSNIFTAQRQTFSVNAPELIFQDTAAPAGSRVFDLVGFNQGFHLRALDDTGTTVVATPLILNRGGDAQIGRDVYEKGRLVPLGHWVDVPFSPIAFSGASGMIWTVAPGHVKRNRYSLVGNTLLWQLWIEGASLSGTAGAELYVTLPASGAAVVPSGAFPLTTLYDGTYRQGRAQMVTGTALQIYQNPYANFTLNSAATTVIVSLQIELA